MSSRSVESKYMSIDLKGTNICMYVCVICSFVINNKHQHIFMIYSSACSLNYYHNSAWGGGC